jgi:hypothetical protein
MAKSNVKWDQEMRKVVYARITMEFGQYRSWGGSWAPKGKRKRYEQVLRELADYLSALSGKSIANTAIEQQIKWAVTTQDTVLSAGYARQFIMNKAAALEMGFLTGPEMPGYMLTQKAATASA